MVLVDLQWIKGTQFFTNAGTATLASGTINIYDATTTSLRTTYSDYLGTVPNTLNGSNQIVLDSSGRLSESVYIPTGLWKFVLKDSSGTTITTEDNIEGALDTDALAITEALPNTPVVSKTSDYTIVNGDQGKVINANPTGGTFTLTLPNAATVGDGWRIGIRHTGTANEVKIASVSSQTISPHGGVGIGLGLKGESVWLVSDGANWHIDANAKPLPQGRLPFIKIVDRLTAPPASPTAGARYILNGTGTGDWASFSQHDVLESDGQGGWIRYTPTEGWFAYVEDENLFTAYVGTAWADQTGMPTPSTSNINTALFVDTEAANTVGGQATTGAWTKREIDSSAVNNDITGLSVASSVFTFPTGEYVVMFQGAMCGVTLGRMRFISTTNSSKVFYSSTGSTDSATDITCVGFGLVIVTAATETFQLEYYATATTGTTDLGRAQNAGVAEFHASVFVIDTASLVGPQGSQGTQGVEGFAGLDFNFDSSTSMADPGAGDLRLNHGTFSSVTAIAIDDTSAATGNPDLSTYITSWDDSSSATDGTLIITKQGAPQNYSIYQVTGLTDNSGWSELAVTYVSSSGSFSNGDGLSVLFVRTGDKGETGASGSTGSTTFNFDSTTSDADPGSGDLRLNNATPASATVAYIDNNNRGGTDISAWLDTFDDGGASAHRGTLIIAEAATPTTNFRIYTVSGTVTDGTGYRKVTIAHVAGGGSFTNGNELVVAFFRTGASGTVGGSTGATDNAVIRADGTGGATVQNSAVTIDDSGNISTLGTLDLGHASDTTVSRNAAGIIQVEAVPLYSQIPQNSQSTAYTAVLTDAQKHILHPAADNNARTFTIPANGSVAYPIGTCLTFINEINIVTIAITTDTLALSPGGTTGSRTLAANGMATAIKITSTKWMISGTGLT